MRLPALALAIAFTSGIAIALWAGGPVRTGHAAFLWAALIAAGALIVAGTLSIRRGWIATGAHLSLAAWFILGVAAAGIVLEPQPNDYVLNRIDAGEIELHTPLRWHGVLRDDPALLPWGTAFDLSLRSVDYEDRSVPMRGGLRVSYSPHGAEEALPDLHAGDEITAVTQARLPQVFRDEGAFDRRAYLRAQGIDLTATLRAASLVETVAPAKRTPRAQLARVRSRLRESLTELFPASPEEAAILRAMLLGDRSFLDRSESANFQKTGLFHVLVVAGLHVGAFAAFVFWVTRKLRVSRGWASCCVIVCVLAYVAVVEQRPPVLRAALMTLIVVLAIHFYRRIELLNSVAIAALLLLIASPVLLADSSFQLSFLALFCIAGLAAPWLRLNLESWAKGLRGWRDVTRDASQLPQVAQFRIDLRSIATWMESKLRPAIAKRVATAAVGGLRLGLRVAEMAVLTVVLQIGMLPLLVRDFHRVTLSGPFANLFAVPLTGLLVPLGFATLALSLVFRPAAVLLAAPLHWITDVMVHGVDRIAQIPHLSYRIPSATVWVLACFFLSSVALGVALRFAATSPRWAYRLALATMLAAALVIATSPFPPHFRHGSFEFTALDVGQGDSLLLVSPAGRTILIDGGGSFTDPTHRAEVHGPDPGEDAVSPYLWSRGFKRIDVVALTHAHQDHLGGLTAILQNFRVGHLWIGREVDSRQQRELEALAAANGTPVEHELRGGAFEFDGARGDFLWPQIAPGEIAPSAKNDDSLVMAIRYGKRHFLLPGDAEKSTERSLLGGSEPRILEADVLKIGHHGSKNSTTPEFLAAVRPRLAIISAGEENPYGHPSPQLLERLEQSAVPYFRTDRDGAIHVLTDGRNLEVSCFVPCAQMTERVNSPRPQVPEQEQNAQK